MTAPPTLIRGLAAQARALWQGGLPMPVLGKAQLCLADALSGAFEAAPLEHAQQAAAVAAEAATGATVIASGRAAPAGDAAFANAVAAHGLVREDMHTGSVAHFGVVVWPALLAATALAPRPVSGRALLAAGVIAYEVGGRVGRELMTPDLARLFRPTGLFGPLATATGTGLVLGLEEEALASAMALAVNTAAGFNEWPRAGGADMFFHAGFAAQSGLRAARLAGAGAFGSPTVLEGDAGLFRAIGRRPAPEAIGFAPEGDFEIMSVFHKAVPACNYAQTPGQAALAAAKNYAAAPDTIASVKVAATEAALAYPGCDGAGPFRNALQAKMSIQYTVAAAILHGEISEACFADPADPAIGALVSKVALEADPALTAAYPARQGARVTIVGGGEEVTAQLDDVQVARDDEIWDRMTRHAVLRLGEAPARDLTRAIRNIEVEEDIGILNGLCRRDGTQASRRSA
ncbi:MmgE/PrpD family protein [Psychromarinibacter sp. C21-152]|uniref:MmgE/PrpD family protein n=1 Tax=Psychromarinibacter sediminicola TaxID=3033385 RepID=A0AAE3T8S5_9RHOB|nr:MmgE/PrpD family protein [Psychromarinibacter sediminicola]MDF0601730.1 MmgE/PrpD family protein [Psychromarinibacter sediminicola]